MIVNTISSKDNLVLYLIVISVMIMTFSVRVRVHIFYRFMTRKLFSTHSQGHRHHAWVWVKDMNSCQYYLQNHLLIFFFIISMNILLLFLQLMAFLLKKILFDFLNYYYLVRWLFFSFLSSKKKLHTTFHLVQTRSFNNLYIN